MNKKKCYMLITHDYKKLSLKIEEYLINMFLHEQRIKVIYNKKAKI